MKVVRIGKASRKGQVSSISGVFERSSKFVFGILVPRFCSRLFHIALFHPCYLDFLP